MEAKASTTESDQRIRNWPLLPCCPLFEPTEEDLFSQVATGTLLKVRNKHFMLTAGHVCDQLAESNFLFPSEEGFSILHGEVAIGDRGRGDIYDFGSDLRTIPGLPVHFDCVIVVEGTLVAKKLRMRT